MRGRIHKMESAMNSGVLERISNKVDVPYFVIELNLQGKDKFEQRRIIRQFENDILSNLGYKVSSEFSDGSRENNIYHLHFRRMEPNA